jgi:hypothetical protein
MPYSHPDDHLRRAMDRATRRVLLSAAILLLCSALTGGAIALVEYALDTKLHSNQGAHSDRTENQCPCQTHGPRSDR